MMSEDRHYFETALGLARQAFARGYSPVGAVLVPIKGPPIATMSERKIGNVYHAEFLALLSHQRKYEVVSPFTLYSTLEPCIMCAGMATVMKGAAIRYLVDDVWAGATRVYNPDNPYVKSRLPLIGKADYPDLHKIATDMWVEYLVATGHAPAVEYMLGLPLDK